MATPTRIYVIAPKVIVGDDIQPHRRLVRAPNSAQALRHVADEFVVALASQDDLVTLTAAGVKVEDAKPEPKGDAS